MPIIGGETSQLAYLMVPLALGTILSRSSILAFHARYLTLPDERQRIAASTSAAVLVLTTIVTLGIAGMIHIFSPSTSAAGIVAWAGYITFTNGIYFMSVAVVTQEQRMDVYSRARLWFGILNISITVTVVFITPFRYGLIFCAGITAIFGTIIILSRTQNKIIFHLWSDISTIFDKDHRSYIRQATGATTGTFLSELGIQFQGLLTPLFGQYQEIWASIVRVTGGFGNLAQQVIAPGFDAQISKSIRSGNAARTRRMCAKALLAGLILSVLCTAALIFSLVFSFRGQGSLTLETVAISAVYCIATLSVSLCNKIPLMKGMNRSYTFIFSIKLTALVALLLTSGIVTFVSVTVIQIIISTFMSVLVLSKGTG
ncbi:hypothetical protein ACTXLS_03920 [Corynebacterium variabile]|uniref:hypothetical protein n=1 Tax=Corynebacterium variabile TaxID=1727 RepID=UPI003FD54920